VNGEIQRKRDTRKRVRERSGTGRESEIETAGRQTKWQMRDNIQGQEEGWTKPENIFDKK
jgi:hypothetical protein